MESGGQNAHPIAVISESDWNYFVGGYDGEKLVREAQHGGACLLQSNQRALRPGLTLSDTWVATGAGVHPIAAG